MFFFLVFFFWPFGMQDLSSLTRDQSVPFEMELTTGLPGNSQEFHFINLNLRQDNIEFRAQDLELYYPDLNSGSIVRFVIVDK